MKSMIRGIMRFVVLLGIVGMSFLVGVSLRGWMNVRKPITLDMARLTDASGAGGAARADSVRGGRNVDATETFQDVLEMVRSEYVDKVDDDAKLSAGAVRTMLYTLDDPMTRYWTKEQAAMLAKQIEGEYSGIGASLGVIKQKRNDVEQRRVCVIAPAPGGPADRAGIRAGDFINEIGDRWVIAYDPRLDLNRLALRTMADTEYRRIMKDATKKLTDGISWPRALERLMQPKDEEIQLTLERAGSPSPIKVKVRPGTTSAPPFEYRQLATGVGYLRVTRFSAGAPKAVAASISSHANARGWVLDLRDNPGGPDLDGAQSPLRAMSASLSAMGVRGDIGFIARGATKRAVTAPANGARAPRLAVLINKGTANLAEMAAAALKTRAGATLIGAASCGDAVYQKLVPLKSGAMTVSAGTLMTASAKAIPAAGLQPGIAVAGTSAGWENDPAVSKAVSVLTSGKEGSS